MLQRKFDYFIEVFMRAFRRFPATIVLAILATIMGAIAFSPKLLIKYMSIIEKVYPLIILGIPLSFSLHLFKERGIIKNLGVMIGVLVALLSTLLVVELFSKPEYRMYRLFTLFIVSYIIIYFAPFVNRNDKVNYWKYVKRIFTNFIKSQLYTIGAMILIFSIMISLDSLINKEATESYDIFKSIFTGGRLFNKKVYLSVYLLLSICFQIVVFAALMPTDESLEKESPNYRATLRNLIVNVLVPLVLVQTVFFYWDIIDSFLREDMENSIITYKLLVFSLFMMTSIILVHPIAEVEKNESAADIHLWIHRLLMPLVILIVGITMSKVINGDIHIIDCFNLYIAIWMGAVIINHLANKESSLRFILISLAVLLFLSVVGPQNVFNITRWSNANRLESLLRSSDMVEDGKLHATKQVMPYEKMQKVNDMAERVIIKNGDFDKVKHLLDDETVKELEDAKAEMTKNENPFFGKESYKRACLNMFLRKVNRCVIVGRQKHYYYIN